MPEQVLELPETGGFQDQFRFLILFFTFYAQMITTKRLNYNEIYKDNLSGL